MTDLCYNNCVQGNRRTARRFVDSCQLRFNGKASLWRSPVTNLASGFPEQKLAKGVAGFSFAPRSSAMPNHRKTEYATYLYEVYYKAGKSLSQIATIESKTRQSVHSLFVTQGFQLRPLKRLPFIVYRGVRYTPRKLDGYYRRTDGNRIFLHQQVWIDNFGPIPFGHDIHHRDHDKTNNDPGNLIALSKSDHTKEHQPRHFVELRPCLQCGQTIPRRSYQGPFSYSQRKFCGFACSRTWMKGKPKGTKAASV